MARLGTADLDGIVAFLGEAAAVDGPTAMPPHLLDDLGRLFPDSKIMWCELATDSCELVDHGLSHEVWWDQELWKEHSHVDPIRPGFATPQKYSDHFGARLRLRHPAAGWLRAAGIRDALFVWLPSPPGRARSLELDRFDREFVERDRSVLSVLRPHLTRLWRNADLRRTVVPEATEDGGLTVRELEVLGLVARGKTNDEIARLLFISPGTVRKHMDNVFARLDVHTRTAAVVRAFPSLNARAAGRTPVD